MLRGLILYLGDLVSVIGRSRGRWSLIYTLYPYFKNSSCATVCSSSLKSAPQRLNRAESGYSKWCTIFFSSFILSAWCTSVLEIFCSFWSCSICFTFSWTFSSDLADWKWKRIDYNSSWEHCPFVLILHGKVWITVLNQLNLPVIKQHSPFWLPTCSL